MDGGIKREIEDDPLHEEEIDVPSFGEDGAFSNEKDPLDLEEVDLQKKEQESNDGKQSFSSFDPYLNAKLEIKQEEHIESNKEQNIAVEEFKDFEVEKEIKSEENESDPILFEHIKIEGNNLDYDDVGTVSSSQYECELDGESGNSNLNCSELKEKLSCNNCGRSFKLSSQLKNHSCSHSGKGVYSCKFCSELLTSAHKLKVHYLHVHSVEKPYSCDICRKTFSHCKSLTCHLRLHTEEKLYSCNICQKTFHQSGELTVHLRVHTKEKPYSCKFCQKTFAQSSNLTVHLRLHTKEKPYCCNVCQKTFVNPSHLKVHLRVHTKERPYICNICQKTFSNSSSLKVHMRLHTKERPYICNICQKTFTNSSSLKVHMRLHTKERPYSCKVCLKTFTNSSSLKVHLCAPTKETPNCCKICQKTFSQSGDLTVHLCWKNVTVLSRKNTNEEEPST